jgi:hypothetical protein
VSRPLRILFVVQHGALLRFALLIPALAERGHEIHIAFPPGGDWKGAAPSDPPQRTLDLLAELQARFRSITYGPVPTRAPGGWGNTRGSSAGSRISPTTRTPATSGRACCAGEPTNGCSGGSGSVRRPV